MVRLVGGESSDLIQLCPAKLRCLETFFFFFEKGKWFDQILYYYF